MDSTCLPLVDCLCPFCAEWLPSRLYGAGETPRVGMYTHCCHCDAPLIFDTANNRNLILRQLILAEHKKLFNWLHILGRRL